MTPIPTPLVLLNTHLLNVWARTCHAAAKSKGFWDDAPDPTDQAAYLTYLGNKLMLIVSELSEAHEGLRRNNPPSEHISEFSSLEEELADVLIRLLDLAGGLKLSLAAAFDAKMRFNASRPIKHGKQF